MLLVGALIAGRHLAGHIPDFFSWIDSLGRWAPLAFVVGYVAATVALVPGSVLTLAAGAVFGLWKGTAVVFVGAAAGAAAAFLFARYLARNAIERRIASWTRVRSLDRAIGDNGFRVVLLLRLSPLFPFNLLNYALGLTRVRIRDYLAASIGMLPATFLYVYYGAAIGSVARLAGGEQIERGNGYWVVFAIGLAATVAVTAYITRYARQALSREVSDD